jgi:hypothetical protein
MFAFYSLCVLTGTAPFTLVSIANGEVGADVSGPTILTIATSCRGIIARAVTKAIVRLLARLAGAGVAGVCSDMRWPTAVAIPGAAVGTRMRRTSAIPIPTTVRAVVAAAILCETIAAATTAGVVVGPMAGFTLRLLRQQQGCCALEEARQCGGDVER